MTKKQNKTALKLQKTTLIEQVPDEVAVTEWVSTTFGSGPSAVAEELATDVRRYIDKFRVKYKMRQDNYPKIFLQAFQERIEMGDELAVKYSKNEEIGYFLMIFNHWSAFDRKGRKDELNPKNTSPGDNLRPSTQGLDPSRLQISKKLIQIFNKYKNIRTSQSIASQINWPGASRKTGSEKIDLFHRELTGSGFPTINDKQLKELKKTINNRKDLKYSEWCHFLLAPIYNIQGIGSLKSDLSSFKRGSWREDLGSYRAGVLKDRQDWLFLYLLMEATYKDPFNRILLSHIKSGLENKKGTHVLTDLAVESIEFELFRAALVKINSKVVGMSKGAITGFSGTAFGWIILIIYLIDPEQELAYNSMKSYIEDIEVLLQTALDNSEGQDDNWRDSKLSSRLSSKFDEIENLIMTKVMLNYTNSRKDFIDDDPSWYSLADQKKTNMQLMSHTMSAIRDIMLPDEESQLNKEDIKNLQLQLKDAKQALLDSHKPKTIFRLVPDLMKAALKWAGGDSASGEAKARMDRDIEQPLRPGLKLEQAEEVNPSNIKTYNATDLRRLVSESLLTEDDSDPKYLAIIPSKIEEIFKAEKLSKELASPAWIWATQLGLDGSNYQANRRSIDKLANALDVLEEKVSSYKLSDASGAQDVRDSANAFEELRGVFKLVPVQPNRKPDDWQIHNVPETRNSFISSIFCSNRVGTTTNRKLLGLEPKGRDKLSLVIIPSITSDTKPQPPRGQYYSSDQGPKKESFADIDNVKLSNKLNPGLGALGGTIYAAAKGMKYSGAVKKYDKVVRKFLEDNNRIAMKINRIMSSALAIDNVASEKASKEKEVNLNFLLCAVGAMMKESPRPLWRVAQNAHPESQAAAAALLNYAKACQGKLQALDFLVEMDQILSENQYKFLAIDFS